MDLYEMGWTESDQQQFEEMNDPTLMPCRVSEEHRSGYRLLTTDGELSAELSGRLRHQLVDGGDRPAVGDWVLARVRADEGSASITAVMPRRTALIRNRTDNTTRPQVIAANLDTVFVMCSLNRDFNLRRIERYLALVWDSGARPVVLLTKADLCDDTATHVEQTSAIAWGVNVHPVSALTGDGIDALEPHLRVGQTVALVGSSGVGKSTLLNRLLGADAMATGEARPDDDRGRHTTSHRSLSVLPGGAMLVDTPGMREVGMWESAEGVRTTFEDVEAYAADCRFKDCRHEDEPGCGVLRAVEDGVLEPSRHAGYLKLQRELAHQERRVDERARIEHDHAMRRIYTARKKSLKQLYKNR